MMRQWPLAVLAGLIMLGFALDALGFFNARQALEWLRNWPAGWPLAAVLIVVQVALFTLALPGSAMVWVVAVLYPPPAATAILTAGGTIGALAAWTFAGRVAYGSVEGSRLVRLLARQSDFFTLCAIRLLPGFPHSLINYAAGTLRLPPGRFLAASAIGLAAKAWLYSGAIHEVAGSASAADLLRWQTLAPLLLLVVLALASRLIQQRWFREEH